MEVSSQSQVLLFFTTDPQGVLGRILRFRAAFIKSGQNFDFAIVSFMPNEVTAIQKKMFGGVEISHHVYGPDAVETLGYPAKGSKKPFRLIPGNCDLVPLLFWKSHPHYQHYWVMEDDVEYSGDPAALFADLAGKDADLLAAHVSKCPDGWTYEKNFRSPGVELGADQRWVTFFPFYRVSPGALAAIDRGYRAGWDGHHEMAWPTILRNAGHSIVDIGGQGAHVLKENINKHYIGVPGDSFEKHGSFGTMQIRLRPGKQKNVLWHPIKKPKAWLKQKSKRTISIVKWRYAQILNLVHSRTARRDPGDRA